MTQQNITTQQTTQTVIPPVMLPYEISKAILESSGALKSVEGVVSGIDTQNERTDLIKNVRSYFEGGLINVGGLIIGVLLLIAGVYLLFLEFKESPRNADVRRVARDVSQRQTAARRKRETQRKERKTETAKRRATYND